MATQVVDNAIKKSQNVTAVSFQTESQERYNDCINLDSIDVDHSDESPSGTHVKYESDCISSDDDLEIVKETRFFIEESEKDTKFLVKIEDDQFIDINGQDPNRKELGRSINMDQSYSRASVIHVKSESDYVSSDDDVEIVDEAGSSVEDNEKDVKFLTKIEDVEQFTEVDGKIWNMKEFHSSNSMPKDTHQVMLPEDMGSTHKIHFESVPHESDAVQLHGKPHQCHLCNYGTTYLSYLKSHIAAVHKHKKSYNCPECDYSSMRKVYVNVHVNRVHGQLEPHKCPLCSFSAATKSDIKAHVNRVHRQLKDHKCDMCSFSAAKKRHLKVHVHRVHMQRPHKCNVCSYSAATKGEIKDHVDSVHT